MEILSIKRPNNGNPKTGLKIYATVQGDSGAEYKVGYFDRDRGGPHAFRGWMCSCPNFVMAQFSVGGHCKHIDKIQETYGRYGGQVPPVRIRAPRAIDRHLRTIMKEARVALRTRSGVSEGGVIATPAQEGDFAG